jgi:DNA-binding GntR family transcriptional regulator
MPTRCARRWRRLHEEMVEHAERAEVQAFFDANARFHQVFVEASGNRKLEEFYRLLLGQMGRYLARSLALRGTVERSVSEHLAILEAVEAGHAERAARLLAEHIEVPQRELAGATELFSDEDANGEVARPGRVEETSQAVTRRES